MLEADNTKAFLGLLTMQPWGHYLKLPQIRGPKGSAERKQSEEHRRNVFDLRTNEAIASSAEKGWSVIVWRLNTSGQVIPGKGSHKRRNISSGKVGQADLAGIVHLHDFNLGIAVEIEMKSSKGRQTKEQKLNQKLVQGMGGIYIVVNEPQKGMSDLLAEILNKIQPRKK